MENIHWIILGIKLPYILMALLWLLVHMVMMENMVTMGMYVHIEIAVTIGICPFMPILVFLCQKFNGDIDRESPN